MFLNKTPRELITTVYLQPACVYEIKKKENEKLCYSISRNKDLISPSSQASRNKTILRSHLINQESNQKLKWLDFSFLERQRVSNLHTKTRKLILLDALRTRWRGSFSIPKKTQKRLTPPSLFHFFLPLPRHSRAGISTSVTSLLGRVGRGGGCQQCNEWRSILSLGQARAFTPRCSPGDTEPRVVARVSQEGYWRSAQGEEGGSRTGHSLPPTSATYACPKRRWQWPSPISSPPEAIETRRIDGGSRSRIHPRMRKRRCLSVR